MKRLLIFATVVAMFLFIVGRQEMAAPKPLVATPAVAALMHTTFASTPVVALMQQSASTSYGAFSSAFAAPAFTSAVGAGTVQYTAGTVYAGGVAKPIIASTTGLGTLGASSTCVAPLMATCTFIYWTSGTALNVTNTLATAMAAGNVLVGTVTTDGSSNILTQVPTSLQLPTPTQVYETCGATVACAKTAGYTAITVTGSGIATTAGVASLTGLPFSDTSFVCMGFPVAVTGTTSVGAIIPLATGATTATLSIKGNSGTDVTLGFTCTGH